MRAGNSLETQTCHCELKENAWENWEMMQVKAPLRPDSKLPGLHPFQHPIITQNTSVPKDLDLWLLFFQRIEYSNATEDLDCSVHLAISK